MPESTSSDTDRTTAGAAAPPRRRRGGRWRLPRLAGRGNGIVFGGIAAILVILLGVSAVLYLHLPDADLFNREVERLFVENDNLTDQAEIKLLEILARSGSLFADTIASYQRIILVLMLFAAALLVAALVFLLTIIALGRRMAEIERKGIHINRLTVDRTTPAVLLNDMEFKLTPSGCETLSVLCEARLDGDFLSGAELESLITGKPVEECDEAAGAMRIKRLRDHLGNQIVSELLIRSIPRKGYVLAIDPEVIEMV